MKRNSVFQTKTVPAASREYKSTMFCMIFRDKKQLLELYNAVNHSDYKDADALEIVTLENAVYMNMKNDLAFLIDMHLNLYEHQSTCNPNMPLRDLFYVAREYQRLVEGESIYASSLVRIPAPHFIVFYNGRAEKPEEEILRLSDAYHTREEDPELELRVRVLNINVGSNQKLLAGCRTLREYMQYVEYVRKYADRPGTTLEEAVECAVRECIDRGILEEFLRKNRAEAISVSIFEYNEAEEKEKLRRAEYGVGYDAGVADGTRKGLEQGIEQETRRGIRILISTCKELGSSFEETAARLKEKYALDDEAVQRNMQIYWQ